MDADNLEGLSDAELDAELARLGSSAEPEQMEDAELDAELERLETGARTARIERLGLVGEGRKYLGRQEDGSDAFEYDAENAPAFAPQDEEGRALHERVKGFRGGTLDHFNRPMRVNRDKRGFAESYSTAASTVVPELDGTFSVVPTVWKDENGNVLSAVDDEDAAVHYRETERNDGAHKAGEKVGERFGNFDTREEAEAAARDVHALHARAYRGKWNQWLMEHWDEVADSVKDEAGMRQAHDAWEKAGRPGIRFALTLSDETGTDAQEKAPKENMGVLEHGAKSLSAETGREYSKGMALLYNVVPFGRNSEKIDANSRTALLERLRTGDYDDRDMEAAAKAAGFRDEANALAAGDVQKKRRILSEMAAEELERQTRVKEEAQADLDARPLTTWGKIASSTLENAGYVGGFVYGSVMMPAVAMPAGLAGRTIFTLGAKEAAKKIGVNAVNSFVGSMPQTVAGGLERATGLANKDYELDERGRLRVIENNYGTLMAALKGGAGSVVENAVVESLTDEALAMGAMAFAHIPGVDKLVRAVARGSMRTGAGRALSRVGRFYGQYGQYTHLHTIPGEQLEEIVQPIFDDVFGLGKRKGEKTDTFGEYYGRMFTSENQLDIFLGLVGTIGLQGGAAAATAGAHHFSKAAKAAHESARTARSILVEANADPKLVGALTDEEAQATAYAYLRMQADPKLADRLASELSARQGVVFDRLREQRDNQISMDLEQMGVSRRRFVIPTVVDGDGKTRADFREQAVLNTVTGKWTKGKMVTDAETGVCIVDNGRPGADTAFTVYDPASGRTIDCMSVAAAKMEADNIVGERQLYVERDVRKCEFMQREVERNYGNANIYAARTIDEAVEHSRESGFDPGAQKGFSRERAGWRLPNGEIVIVRDNVHTPHQFRTLLRHEAVGHSGKLMETPWLESSDGSEIGRLRERNLARTMGRGPATEGETARALRESVANVVQRRAHKPTLGESLASGVRSALRRLGYDVKMNDADLEVAASKVEKAMRTGSDGDFELAPILRNTVEVADAGQEAAEAGKGQENADETGSQPDEAPAQPEPGAKRPAGEETPGDGTGGEAQGAEPGVEPPPAERKPVAERTVVEKMTDEAPVEELDVAGVVNDDTRIPNFKEGANPETGEVEPLKGEPYDLVSNPIVVMEFKDGKKVVVTGRHRLALYRRAGRRKIAARVIREADGWTVDDAKMIDSIGNIIDEKGSAKDYVRYFDDARPSREAADAGGFLARPKGKLAFGIYEGATADTRAAVDWEGSGSDGMISAEQAGIIAEAAPKGAHPRNAALQRILVARALKGLRGRKLEIFARMMAEEARRKGAGAATDGGTQLDLFSSPEDQALLAAEERRADYRARRGREYRRVAETLRTAMSKGGRLDLNKNYAKELGITDPKDRTQLAAARDKAVERADYWENAVRLDDADRAAMDAELGAAQRPKETPKPAPQGEAEKPGGLALESVTREQLADEERRRRERKEIEERQSRPLKGGQTEEGQSLLDLGGAEGEDLFNRTQRKEGQKPPVSKTETTEKKPSGKGASAVFTRKDGTAERLDGYAPADGAELSAGREVAVQHDTGGEVNARQKILGTVTGVRADGGVEVEYRDGWGNAERDVFRREEVVGVKPLVKKGEQPAQRPAENAPAGAPKKAEATARPKAAKPVGRKEEANAGVPSSGVPIEDAKRRVTVVTMDENGRPVRKSVTPEEAEAMGMVMSASAAGPAKGSEKPSAANPKKPRAPSVRMKNAEEERKAKAALDAIDFDTPELGADGTIVSGDEVRKTMPGYDRLDWSTHVDRTGYVGPRLEAQFRRLLKERKGKGDGTVVFLAGGNGAGKSTVAAKFGTPDFTIDSTLGNLDVAKRQIDAILANGQTPEIHFVYRAPGQALEGIKARVKNGGHIVSPLSFANSHVRSRENLRLLSEAYGDRLHIRIYDNSVPDAPEITLEQLEAKRKPDHAKLREEANYYLGHLRGQGRQDVRVNPGGVAGSGGETSATENRGASAENRGPARRDSQGGAAGSGAKGQQGQVDFDSPDFDYERFGRLVTGVGRLVDVLTANGHRDFRSLAQYIAERDAAKYERARPVLQDVWNAVARQKGLTRVSDGEAESVFGIIERKEAEDGRVLGESGRADGDGDSPLGSALPEQDAGPAEGGTPGHGGPAGGQGGAGVRVPGEAGLQGHGVGSRPGERDPDAGGAGDGAGHGGGRDAAGEAAGQGVRAPGGRGEAGGGGARGERGALHDDGGGRERGRAGGAEGGGAAVEVAAHVRVRRSAGKAADATKPGPPRRDFAMTKAVEAAILERGTARRVRGNLAAIRLVRELKSRGYAATPEEQETLAKFVGWGGLRESVFGYGLESAYEMERAGDAEGARRQLRRQGISQGAYDLHKELRQVLNDAEYESAKKSSSTAFYTPVEFVRILHDALRALGVKGGRFLGPSAGTGNFASAAGAYEGPVRWQLVEKDVLTGEMLKALFPNQRVTVGGFEETKFPDGFFDFAVDNVPYADVPVSDRSLSQKMFKIHDYFFAKTLAKLRPGGVMAFLTSTGTLDKTSPILRQFLTEHGGRIVGAVRLPNGFFAENAGTDAASDLVVVQKAPGRPDNSAFEKGVEYGKTEAWVSRKGVIKKPLTYNGYFGSHPEQVVGEMAVASGQFGPTLRYAMPQDGKALWERVREAVGNAFSGVDRTALLKGESVAEAQERAPVYDAEGLRQGNVTMKDGKAFIKSGDVLEPVPLPNGRDLKRELARRKRSPGRIMDDLLALRKAMRDVIDAQMAEVDGREADLAPLWARLNETYDAFVRRNGSLHDKWVTPFVLLDKADGNRLLALERKAKDANGDPILVKSDIFSKRVISRGRRATRAETPRDALVISHSETGGISVPRIAELLGVDEAEAVARLKEAGDAFENPQTGLLEPSWQYLSGRVRAKLAAARAAVEAGEESFRANVEALEKVQPPMVRLEDAEIKFGAPWVDPECMKDFLREAFGSESMRISLGKNEVTGQWNVDFGRVMNEDPWGETSWDPKEFVGRVLNHGSLNHYVTDPVDKKRYLDERKTEANKLAAEKLHGAFSQFIQSSEKWAASCYERYNAVMTDMVEIRLPDSVLPFRAAGMSEDALGKLFEGGDPKTPKRGREYQSQVIARGVLGGSSLCLAHCVGAGKTLEMQAIGVIGRHLGLFRKPMYVVPNHMLEQFANEFVEAFPNANILKMGEDDVKPANRRAFFAQVANGDWDAIVVKHSTFSMKLAMSDKYQREFIEAQVHDLKETIAAMRAAGAKISTDQANKVLKRLEEKAKNLANAEGHDSQIVPFEELGVDQLFVDEAHNFKGLSVTTRRERTGGLQQGDSQRAADLEMKTQYVQSLHGGDRGVVFATGTPLSNAPVVEAYVMLRYLAPNRLREQGLWHFDDFVNAFGRISTESVFSEDGKTVKEKEQVSAFVNIPELMQLLRSAVDIVNADQLDIPRPKPKYHMVDVEMTPTQERIMEMVAREAAIPGGKEHPNKMLELSAIAKMACLSPRLLGYGDGGDKIIRAVAEIRRVYDETAGERGAQLVFTDIFNGSDKRGAAARAYLGEGEALRGADGFNLNEEIRSLLVQSGIPKDEIAVIQDVDRSRGDRDENKAALFAKVRSGDVRILIGSRPKMGEGTNVQERLAAIHLLHPGWKPSEDEQAIGRIIRYGNTYKEAHVFYYLTKGNARIGSYETRNHQLIGAKSRLIDQVMHGDGAVRSVEMDEGAIDRDMLMGLASGNKALMELVDVKKRVHKLELNTESTASSARRNKDRAEANARILERRREEFAKEQEGVREWRGRNDGKPFALSTPDGRTVEKVKDMAEHVAAQMTRLLTQDRYSRNERTVLGDFNGVELVLAYDKWGDEKFRLAVPLLGVAREVNYSGFIPDFSPAAMTAFKGKILEAVSPDYAKAYENSLADLDRQAKKMSADADRLQKDYEGMRGELVKLRSRQAELERTVTPLLVQAVKDRKTAAYGNWTITKVGGEYAATRESDGKRLSAPTVKGLIPLMDAEDFASPRNAATKTLDLDQRLGTSYNDRLSHADSLSVSEVDFDSPELDPLRQNAENGTIRAVDERRVRATVDALSSGTIRHPRFTRQEVKASNGTEHGKFWNIVLSLEPADVHAGGGSFGSSRSGGNGSRGGKGLGLVRELATRYGRSPVEVVGERRKYLDGGVESKVFLNENGRVVKVRRLSAYSVDGVVGELAKIAYHNYLFPKDAYTLVDLAVHENGGYDEYYLVLEQPFVTPLTDGRGNIVPPTDDQIFAALQNTPERFSVMGGVDESCDASESGDVVEAAKMTAYNGQHVVYDFQPGRNTFIDAETGEVRFIDPRVDLNDPGAGFPVSRFGERNSKGTVRRASAASYDDYDGYDDYEDIDFDSPELTSAEAEYAASEDKTPTEEVMRKVYGMTNEEIAVALRAAGMEPPKHVRKPDETAWKQAEALLSSPSYMAKLSRAVAKFPRNIADYENDALNVLFRQRQAAVNDAESAASALKETLDAIEAIPAEERDADFSEARRQAARDYGEARARLAKAKALMSETGLALTRSSSEAGRRLRSNRGLIDRNDYSYAGISGQIADIVGGADKITPEMDAKIREIAGEFASLDAEGRDLATARLKAHAEKIVAQMRNGGKVRKAVERKAGDEARRVLRNYNEALAQIEVGSVEVGGTLVGLSDQQYPSWGRWLKWIGEYHCFENPDITEDECIAAIVEDVSPFMDGVDANQVRDALTGFGHNFRQSRYEAQRLMNDLKIQSRGKRQLDWMDETNTMPPLTGMVRDEPSDESRAVQKQVRERKKEIPDAGRDARRLKGVLESAKTRARNRIADLERAIKTGERIPGRERTVTEDIELRALRKRKEELQKEYDALFRTENGMTDEQRVKLAERLLGRELEHAIEDLDRARSGDFSKRPRRAPVSSPSLDVLRERLSEVRKQIRELKRAKYEFGMTPEELEAYNARKMANREKAIARLVERVANGDTRTGVKPQPPMPKEMQRRYDELGERMKKGRLRLADLREEAARQTGVQAWERTKEYGAFALAAQRALKTTIDLSSMLNQAARITLGHPAMAARSFAKAWRAMGSELDLSAVNDEIMSDPAIREAVGKYGLHLREVDAENGRDVDMFKGMESQRVSFFGKRVAITDIPFYGQLMLKSERHYITYLNAVSAELYAHISGNSRLFPGGMTAWQKKQLCDMINIWNGSGAMSKERRQAQQKSGWSHLFFSLPLTISQLQTTALQDVFRPAVARGLKNADGGYDAVSKTERRTMVRVGAMEHAKGLLAMTLLGALIRWLFADDDDRYAFERADPVEKFLLMAAPKVGDTTLDFSGGNLSLARKLYQIVRGVATGRYRTGTGREVAFGGYGAPSVATIVGRTLQGKAAPWVSTLLAMAERRDFVGERYDAKAALLDLFAPMSVVDMYEQYAHNGVARTILTAPLTVVGARASTYDRKAYENAVNRFAEDLDAYRSYEADDLLDERHRRAVLDSIKASNPLMRDDVREDIAAAVKSIRRDEAKARRAAKDGLEPDPALLSEIARGKAELLEKIRAARRR